MSDNDKLQKLFDAGQAIPKGEYQVDVTKPIILRASGKFDLRGSIFKGVSNDADKGAILKVQGSGISIIGGTFYGDKPKGKVRSTGNGPHGISIVKDSRVITLDGATISDCMGDGIYIDNADGVLVSRCKSLRNRRQGLSLIAGKNISIVDSTFSETGGTRPGDGIDIEPDKGDAIDGVLIARCIFAKNAGAHIEIAAKRGAVKNIKINSNTFDGKSAPLKVQGKEPSLWARVMGFLGDYSGYPTEIAI